MRDSTRLRTVLAVLLLISLTLVALELRSSGAGFTKSIRTISFNIISPFQKSARSFTDSVQNFGSTWREIRTAREKVKLQNELNELRSQYNTTMSDLEKSKQQSNVAQAIEQMGLKELRTPPQVIDVEQGFFDDKSAQK